MPHSFPIDSAARVLAKDNTVITNILAVAHSLIGADVSIYQAIVAFQSGHGIKVPYDLIYTVLQEWVSQKGTTATLPALKAVLVNEGLNAAKEQLDIHCPQPPNLAHNTTPETNPVKVIQSYDLSEDTEVRIKQLVSEATNAHTTFYDMARHIASALNSELGGTWGCFVGRAGSAEMSMDGGRLIQMRTGDLHVWVFIRSQGVS